MRKTNTKNTIQPLFLPILFAAILLGCSVFDHQFRIRFETVDGLVKNAPVFFGDTVIGKVAEIEYTDAGHFLVEVSIEDQFSSWTTSSSTFYIGANPDAEGQKAVRVIPGPGGGEKIAKNAVVRGESKYVALYKKIAGDLFGSVHEFGSGIEAFLQRLQDYPTDEQIEAFEKELDRILAEIENMSAQMKQKLENDILPRLKEKMEQLRRSLEQTGKEEKLDRVEEKLNTISEQVRV